MIAKAQPAKQPLSESGTAMAWPTDRGAAEGMLRRLHENLAADPSVVEQLIHPQAEMCLLVSYGRPLRGRAAVINALERGREAEMYRAQVTDIEWLGERTALTSGRARYALEQGGFADARVYWLDEFRAGIIWRVRVFRDSAQARKALQSDRSNSTTTHD